MEMMNDLFYKEPYTKEFETEVISCTQADDHYEVVLEDTAFYPEGGGQPADHGTLNDIAVYDTRKKNGVIIHYTKEEVKGHVKGKIDWSRRFEHMQLHSAEHLVSGLIHKHFGYDNVGFHMGECVQIDFDGMITNEQLKAIEDEANELIYLNKEIEVDFPDEKTLKEMDYRAKIELSGVVRIVTVPDADCCACCGTHVKQLGEIGLVKMLSLEKHKNGVRIQMSAGRRALKEVQKQCDENHAISVMLSAKIHETSESVKQLQNTNTEQRYEINRLREQLLSYRMNAFEENSDLIIDFEEGLDRNLIRKMATDLCDTKGCKIAAILNGKDRHYEYVILSRSFNMKDVVKDLNTRLNGRGGGNTEMIQGCYEADEEMIRKILEETFRSE